MENKIINGTDLGPRITLETNGNIGISGKSRMEDASLYYQEVHDWISNYISNSNNKPLTIKIKLDYFNSSSAKQLLKMLMLVEDSPIKATIVWIYPIDNDVLLERGQELEIMLDLPFEYHGYSGDINYEMP